MLMKATKYLGFDFDARLWLHQKVLRVVSLDEIQNDYYKDCLDIKVGDAVVAINGSDVEL